MLLISFSVSTSDPTMDKLQIPQICMYFLNHVMAEGNVEIWEALPVDFILLQPAVPMVEYIHVLVHFGFVVSPFAQGQFVHCFNFLYSYDAELHTLEPTGINSGILITMLTLVV